MSIIVSNIKTGLGKDREGIFETARRTAKLKAEQIEAMYLVKSSVDARKKSNIHIVSSVSIVVKGDEAAVVKRAGSKDVQLQKQEPITFPTGGEKLAHQPVIVGFVPSGMFAGMVLARLGYEPIILERGADVDSRVQAVEDFWQNKQFSPQTNVQFGEGGAGTFSDGKLTTRISDPRCGYILEELIRHGAPEEIRHKQKPHVGTDHLRHVVKSIREEIKELGGQVRFGVKMERILRKNGHICGVLTSEGKLPCEQLVLAIGHSARDTFEMLQREQILLEPKPFSVGVRVEHPQTLIDEGLYGDYAGHPALPKGEYQLSHRVDGRGVYTFCMCPGGVVVPSSSEEETIVTNGMSHFARDGENANSAVVVSVDSGDFGSGALAGVAFQRKLERAAFELGGRSYAAPAQTVTSYLGGRLSLDRCGTRPTFACGVAERDLHELFPQAVNEMLELGFRTFDRKIRGFGGERAVITGPETRTSSPVRITRGEELQAIGLAGLYPCGEGAGYAGGIVSAAVDGVRIAQKIAEDHRPLR
ncbi:MAG: hypothetical protein IJ411_02655 [Oscillospiraceae bacterium]|nr:hypothetical protein [Oscillospiraceae bacterium]